MFTASADFYDLIYRTMKDYRAEAARVADLVRAVHPAAVTLLDVACGTGEHARHLAEHHGFRVDGLDLNPRFVELAAAKNPAGDFREADMTAFSLGRRYDAVVCLFGSIGYALDLPHLENALQAMARHVEPEGVLIVEPWFAPGAMEDRHVSSFVAESDEMTVNRMGYTRLDGRTSRIVMEYVVGTPEGLDRVSETHELGLFTREEMEAAFRAAGLRAEYDDEGLMGRGLYHARRPKESPAHS